MIDGLKALEEKMSRMSRPAKEGIRDSLDNGANRIANLARSLVPVDEGELKESIRVSQGRHELAVDIKAGGKLTRRPVRAGITEPEYDYAAKIEYKQPFFYPSYRALKKTVQRSISKAIRVAANLDSKR
ncbi:HK97 gp10 family phage protein [Mesorhizobium sp. B2-3-5]|uniref:HK97 gp10 family phage protein n=1 Tax=Mesorhizobium sp. B2-3-5 TaxID=2589958 RepID=UPI00112C3FFC|nr:HK97 gp10 family phage protein [Mesorhizobium sp. B2-3-5]TPM36633.1 HK97 gp10 family phage protein [Mesorhizobium sp. B2-3-5]